MSEIQALSTENYLSLKDDPVSLLQFINKFCSIQLIKNTKFSGFVHSIDPISKSLILAVPQGNTFQVILIPGHAIINISETEQNLKGISPFKKIDAMKDSNESLNIDILSRKSKVMEWLKINLIPVVEFNENISFGNVQIIPPYDITNICTDNPIVAMQIRKILEQIPPD